MSAERPQDSPEFVTITIRLGSPDWQLETRMTVPSGPTRSRQMLPLVQSLTDAVVNAAAKTVEAEGKSISCKKGCGACCRQLVPISEVEARRMGEVVEEMPEPRRSQVRARFAEARRRLEAAGLLDMLEQRAQWTTEGRDLGLKYFAAGIPCPFLEDEACSIHQKRPLACREYLVTSPAANCAQPTPETIECVPMPFKVWNAVARVDEVRAGSRWIPWVPLVLAPDWAQAHPDTTVPRPGPQLLRDFFEHLTRRTPPPTQAPTV
jgi:Fe-S-cluster containining protein